jgi:hypothetical protein
VVFCFCSSCGVDEMDVMDVRKERWEMGWMSNDPVLYVVSWL